jgi:hypothetical protein
MKIVVSGINIHQAGPLEILRELLEDIVEKKSDNDEVILFCHDKNDFINFMAEVNVIEKYNSRLNWLIRIFYEYIYFYFWSWGKGIDVWISAHDLTPNVRSKKRCVYYHNVLPFYKFTFYDFFYDPVMYFYGKIYLLFVKINLHKNTFIFIQSEAWVDTISEKLNIHIDKIKTIKPKASIKSHRVSAVCNLQLLKLKNKVKYYIYPAFPRVFKNHQVLIDAAKRLDEDIGIIFTMEGNENRYAKSLKKNANDVNNIIFSGFLDHDRFLELLQVVEGVVFSSMIESWGLPLTEAKLLNKKIVVIDKPYSRDNLKGYNNVIYVEEKNINSWTDSLSASARQEVNYINIKDEFCSRDSIYESFM